MTRQRNPSVPLIVLGTVAVLGGGLTAWAWEAERRRQETARKEKRAARLRCSETEDGFVLHMGSNTIALPDAVSVVWGGGSCGKQTVAPGESKIVVFWEMGSRGQKLTTLLESVIKPLALTVEKTRFEVQVVKKRADRAIAVAMVVRTFLPGKPGQVGERLTGWYTTKGAETFENVTEANARILEILDAMRQTQQEVPPGSNQIRFIPTGCQPLLGNSFLPVDPKAAIEEPTLNEALFIESNTAWGYVDWLLQNDPLTMGTLLTAEKPVDVLTRYIAYQVLTGANPEEACGLSLAPIDPDTQVEAPPSWPKALREFYSWLVITIRPWVRSYVEELVFDG